MKVAGIYEIVNTINGKRYIGSSVGVERRLYIHRRLLSRGTHHSVALQRAWDAHGAVAFVFRLVEPVADVTRLLAEEQRHIDAARSYGDGGYNMCPVAGTRKGSKQPPSVAAAQSARMKGKPKSAEQRAKMSAAAKGRAKSPKHRANLAAAVRERMTDLSLRARIAAALTGRKRDPDAVRRTADALRGRPMHPNTRAALHVRASN